MTQRINLLGWLMCIFLLKNENQAAVKRPVCWIWKLSSAKISSHFDKGYKDQERICFNLQKFILLQAAPILLKFMCSINVDDLSQKVIYLRNLHLALIIKLFNDQVPSKIISKSTTIGLFWSFRFLTDVSFHFQSLWITMYACKNYLITTLTPQQQIVIQLEFISNTYMNSKLLGTYFYAHLF